MALIQNGNDKLKAAGMLMFNLPATQEVCSMQCTGCYAIREQKRFPSVLEVRNKRYLAAQQDDFKEVIHAELTAKRTRPKYFRLHSSGEFFSQKYVNDWVWIAEQNPDITFYAYTKRMKDFDFSVMLNLKNFVLINSLQRIKLNYGPLEKAPLDAFICPDVKGNTTIRCGLECTYCQSKAAQESAPYFIKH